jgi:hypothetical protein
MKVVTMAGIMLVLAVFPAFGEIYRCIDEKGRNVISNTPCPQNTREAFSDQSHKGDGAFLARTPSAMEQPKSQEPPRAEWREPDGQPSEALITACVDKYRDYLKDPRSPYVYKATIKRNKLYLDARAKNSFGGYIPGTFICPLRSDGAIDEKGLELYLAAFQFGITLKE